MLKIYGVYRSRASRNIWLCNEMGVPYEHVPVMQVYRLADPNAADAPLHTRSPSFLALNPSAQIPAIEDDGYVLTESIAINLYLARKHGGPLAPANLQEEGEMLRWSFWAAAELELQAITVLYNRVGKPPAERDEAAALAAIEALKPKLAVLDAHLAARGDFMVGRRFTVADINVAEVVRYAAAAPEVFAQTPRLKAWYDACQARPAFLAMWAKRNAEPA
jgi:glutathione S-transferase